MKNFFVRLKNWYVDLSITRKIYLFNLVAIIIPVTILVLLSTKVSSDIIVERTVNNSKQSINIINESLNNLFTNIEDLSRVVTANRGVLMALRKVWEVDWMVVNDNEELDYLSVVRAILDNVSGMKAMISSMTIYGAKGQFIASSYFNSYKPIDRKDLEIEYVRESYAQNGESIWIDTFSSYEQLGDSRQSITMMQAIISPLSKDFIGVSEVKIDKSIFSQLFAYLDYEKLGRFFIINSKGDIISTEKEQGTYKNIIQEKYKEWVEKENDEAIVYRFGKEKFLVNYQKFDYLDWMIVGIIPMNELVSENTRMIRIIYLISIVCIALEILFSFIISRSITKPVVELSNSMANAGQGDLEVRMNVNSNDEIGIMSKSFNRMVEQISGLMDQVYEDQKNKRVLELRSLQSQINPHFLYNSLESVCALAQLNRNEDVFNMVKSLAMFYRSALSGGDNIIEIKEEIKNVQHYLTIQKIRYNEKLDYVVKIDDSILTNKIIKLSIQPLVENAIYHGLKNVRRKGMIWILGKRVDDVIRISIIDNGIGMDEAKLKKILSQPDKKAGKRSLGLRSVDERIKLWFGPKYGVKIDSRYEKWTRVDLLLPLNDE